MCDFGSDDVMGGPPVVLVVRYDEMFRLRLPFSKLYQKHRGFVDPYTVGLGSAAAPALIL
jgi:hypothetical protein